MEKVAKKDFIELDYTGKLADGTIFDTTYEKTAKSHKLKGATYKPSSICIGERHVVPGLDEALEGKELNKEYTITIPAEKAFGKKDAKNIRLVPMRTFQKENIMPQPGLRINIDGAVATVLRVSGGRILVDFNHPLAGREITYDLKIKKKITDKKAQIESYLSQVFPFPVDVSIQENKATVTMQELSKEIAEELSKKLKEVTDIDVQFKKKERVKAKAVENPTTQV